MPAPAKVLALQANIATTIPAQTEYIVRAPAEAPVLQENNALIVCAYMGQMYIVPAPARAIVRQANTVIIIYV